MNILFYSPFNNRSRDTESLMLSFKEMGHRVISLSQNNGDFIHPFLRKQGIDTFSFVLGEKKGSLYFLQHLIHLIWFCYRNRVDVIYSHLESANFVSSLAQYFVRARVFICRHHIDEARLRGFDRALYYRLTYKLAKHIIVVSNRGLDYMVKSEGIPMSKIHKINLAYDFKLYSAPCFEKVSELRTSNVCDVLLLSVARLTSFKRIDLSIETLYGLVKNGIDARLMILGAGSELVKLKELAISYGLYKRISFPGHVQNVADYLAASDYLVHPSILESSCVIVKEAGLIERPVIVCKDVGDFDEYIFHKKNGFIVDPDHFADQAVACIMQSYKNKAGLANMGYQLNLEIIRHFSIENIIFEYNKLNSRA